MCGEESTALGVALFTGRWISELCVVGILFVWHVMCIDFSLLLPYSQILQSLTKNIWRKFFDYISTLPLGEGKEE